MTLGTQTNFQALLDVSDMVSRREGGYGDTLWLTLECTSIPGGDTQQVDAIDVAGYYTIWCQGGHI